MLNRILILLLALAFSTAVPLDKQEEVPNEANILTQNYKELPSKRNVIQFGVMVRCATGRSALDYNLYGCWCGLGGGGNPVDDVDRCCQIHDRCYDRAVDNGSCRWSWLVYFATYKVRGCTSCDSTGSCEQAICQCDAEAAGCFKRSTWNKRYHYHKLRGGHC